MRRLIVIVLAPFIISSCGGSPTTPTQAPAPCAVVVDNTNISIGFAAGSGVVVVNAVSGCQWTATVASNFLTVTSGTPGSGAGTIAFSAIENTGGQIRTATINVTPTGGAAVAVVVTQQVAPPPIVWVLPAIAPAIQGRPYNQSIATATGGTGTFHYQLDTFGGFPPIGLILAPDGVISGTANIAGPVVFRVCAVDTTQRQLCQPMTINVTVATTTPTGGAANGNWSGTIVLQVGCTTPLPQNYPWSGTIRTGSGGGSELVVSVPRAFVFNEVHALTINGQRLQFTVEFDSLYTFVADFSADFRSLSGTFTGGNCNVPPTVVLPSGTWAGTRQ